MTLPPAFDGDRLAALCRRYHIVRLDLFGSRARGTAHPDSDVDLLVTFERGWTPGLEFFGLAGELALVFGHPVDLLTHDTVVEDRNPFFRDNVLSHTELLYAA